MLLTIMQRLPSVSSLTFPFAPETVFFSFERVSLQPGLAIGCRFLLDRIHEEKDMGSGPWGICVGFGDAVGSVELYDPVDGR